MNSVDISTINAECIHAIKLAIEGLLAAGFLTFCYMVAPYVRNGGSRR